jgi:hypothetical protein
MLDISTGKKFPSYPVTQPSEPFDLEELTNQDSQVGY